MCLYSEIPGSVHLKRRITLQKIAMAGLASVRFGHIAYGLNVI